jgi:predicted O-methyltransferase YrrM
MTDFTSESLKKDVDSYLLDNLPARDALLTRMEEYAVDAGFPFVGPLAGNMISMLARSIQAKRILDLGSGFGFSAIHFARAMPEDGTIICVDSDDANRKRALGYFKEAGLSQKLDFRTGDAIELLGQLSGKFDIIYCDIDKERYPLAFQDGWPLLRKGGMFIADNLLWHGRVMTDDTKTTTQGIREFTRLIFETSGAQSMIVPIRDGVSVTLKTA